MKRWLIFFCLLVNMAADAQQVKLLVSVCDSSGAPLPYVVIRSADKKWGTFTNESGIADISSLRTDSLIITAVGYHTLKLPVSTAAKACIEMQSSTNNLDSIVITAKKNVGYVVAGIESHKSSFSWTSAGFGDEFAQLISFPDSAGVHRISKIHIPAGRFHYDIPMVMHIYSVGKNRLPAEELLHEQIILTKDQFNRKKKKFTITLSKRVVITEDSFFIAVEWLPINNPGPGLGSTALLLTDAVPQNLTFSRAYFYNGDQWMLAARMPGQINPTNTMITIEADIIK